MGKTMNLGNQSVYTVVAYPFMEVVHAEPRRAK